MSTTQPGEFTIKRATLVEKGFEYETFKVSGWLNGQSVRPTTNRPFVRNR